MFKTQSTPTTSPNSILFAVIVAAIGGCDGGSLGDRGVFGADGAAPATGSGGGGASASGSTIGGASSGGDGGAASTSLTGVGGDGTTNTGGSSGEFGGQMQGGSGGTTAAGGSGGEPGTTTSASTTTSSTVTTSSTTSSTSTSTTSTTLTNPPVVPVITSAVHAHMVAILSSTAGLLNYRNVFAKVGDSITESGSFLKDVGCENPPDPSHYGSYASLIGDVDFFRNRTFPGSYSDAWCGISNAFTRASHVAMSGMLSSFPMSSTTTCAAPNNTRLLCEYSLMKPSYALIMYGTNDVLANINTPLDTALAQYRSNLEQIVDISVTAGVIPVLSTIPPLMAGGEVTQGQADRVPAYNAVVIDVSATKETPLWNYYRAMLDLGAAKNYGVSGDGIHPSIYNGSDGGNFTSAGLGYGYNVRNLTAVQVLAALRADIGN